MPQRIMGLDLGSWSVKAVLVEDAFRGFQVVTAREVRVPPGTPDTKGERQLAAARMLLAEEAKVDAYAAGIPGEQAVTRFVALPFQDAKKIEATMAGELADVVPFEIGDAVIDHALVRKTEDGGSVSLAAVVRKNHVASVLAELSQAGVDPKYLPVDVLQLYNLYTHFLKEDQSKAEAPATASPDAGTAIVLSPDGPPEARLVVDIGHERTLVCACWEEGIAYQRAIRAGGADVTRGLATKLEASFEDAEALKHAEGFVASSRHPAPSEAAQEMSEVVTSALSELIRELRRTLQTIRAEKKVRVSRIDLLGGGSRIRNLANWLAEQLNVPTAHGVAVEQIVERQVEPDRRPAFALALAYTLRAVGEQPVSKIDLRVGEFAFAGQLRNLRSRGPFIAASAGVLAFLWLVNVAIAYRAVSVREKAIDQQFCVITKNVIGKEICEAKIALTAMAAPTSELGNVKLPTRSALNVASDLSEKIPSALDVKIDEIDITPERARVQGETVSYDAVDQIVAEYQKDECYKDVKKGNLRKKADGNRIEFQLTVRLGCT